MLQPKAIVFTKGYSKTAQQHRGLCLDNCMHLILSLRFDYLIKNFHTLGLLSKSAYADLFLIYSNMTITIFQQSFIKIEDTFISVCYNIVAITIHIDITSELYYNIIATGGKLSGFDGCELPSS